MRKEVSVSNIREFTYKGKKVRLIAAPSVRDAYIAIPVIDGVRSGGGIGTGGKTVKEALDAAQEKAKEPIDAAAKLPPPKPKKKAPSRFIDEKYRKPRSKRSV
jgi:pyruvate/2-oxoglutarate dehydrogenase complex dihydrolipoamide acyltransferase (E2) component